ncbi:MAG: class I SAM-dependent DNA methyltransferase [Promethearchaeota archaeon]
MTSIEKIAPQYFLDFFNCLYPSVEIQLKKNLIQGSPICNKINAVLHEISWSEWQDNLTTLVKPLSTILITLFYDKTLFTLQRLGNSDELDLFLDNVNILNQSHIMGKITFDEAHNQFINLFRDLWKLTSKSDPRIPILDVQEFPLNKLIDQIFMDWESCLKSIDLIQNLKAVTIENSKLLLPYIFEFGIPEQRKQSQGQVFTPLRVIDFICNQNITEKTTRVIDPACGTGIFLLGALKVLFESKTLLSKRIELIGIEKDPLLANIAKCAIHYFLQVNKISSVKWVIFNDDFFNYSRESPIFSRKSSGTTTLLMNPPYTRHEILSLGFKEFLKSKIKEDLQEITQAINSSEKAFSGRSGLYVYFLIHATLFLEEGDNLGLIIPNSWLDVDYGLQLQQFLLKHYLIESIINCTQKKIIPNADVNVAILNLIRKKITSIHDFNNNELVNFISIRDKNDLKLLINNKLSTLRNFSSELRVFTIKQKNLYRKSKWGVYLRAPKEYFLLMEKYNAALISLGEIARVRRGFTSGANEFFYVGKPGESNRFFISSWNPETGELLLYLKDELIIKEFLEQGFYLNEPMFLIEKEYWMHRVDTNLENSSWDYSFKDADGSIWVPNYLVKSPRKLPTYEIQEKDLIYVVILISHHSSSDGLKTGIQEYIRWGEQWIPTMGKKFNQRPTCKSRKYWYSLPSDEYKAFNLLCLMTINDRFPFFYNPQEFYFDARFYGIQFLHNELQQKTYLFAHYFLYLNSIYTTLQLELLGRSNLGEGGLDIKVYEYELLKIPSYEFLTDNFSKNAINVFFQVLNQSPFSVIQEEPYTLKQLTDEFLANLFTLSQISIDRLFNKLKNIVQMRVEKAK